MNVALTFLEGLASFVSPCLLPLLPVYVAYFAADRGGGRAVAARALAFVLGFSTVFVSLGVFAGSLGAALAAHKTSVDAVCGVAVIVFGLGYLGLFRLPFSGTSAGRRTNGVTGAFVFGLVYSVNLTPCVGAFLGAALMQAASAGGAAKGAALLAAYCFGLGVPFAVSAVLLARLGSLFGFIKRHYGVINPVCGALLVLFGGWMAYGALTGGGRAGRVAPPGDGSFEVNSTTDKEAKMEIELTSANFEAEVVKSEIPVLVDFWATWCGPCRMLAPHVEALANEKAGVLKVGKVNVDDAADLAAQFGITSIPTLILFKGGKPVAQSVGYVDKDALGRFVAQ